MLGKKVLGKKKLGKKGLKIATSWQPASSENLGLAVAREWPKALPTEKRVGSQRGRYYSVADGLQLAAVLLSAEDS